MTTTTILGILLALVAGYSVYQNAEHLSKDEKIKSLSTQLSKLVDKTTKIEVDKTAFAGVLSTLLEVTSKSSVKKANKKLEDFKITLSKDNSDEVNLTADIVTKDDGKFGVKITEITEVTDEEVTK